MYKRILLVLSVFLFVLVGCTTVALEPSVIPSTALPVVQDQVIVTAPPRVIDSGVPKPYEGSILLYNATGEDLTTFDVFSPMMLNVQPYEENLLSEPLNIWGHVTIPLREHPLLWDSITQKDGTVYAINARSSGNSLYMAWWNPLIDSWTISLRYEHEVADGDERGVPAYGSEVVIANNTDEILTELYIGSSSNLLFGTSLEYRHEVHIPISMIDFTDVVNISAINDHGLAFNREVHPDRPSWHFTLTDFDIDYMNSPGYLSIDNQTGVELWYLYFTPDSYYQMEEYGEDILEDDVLENGYYQTFYIGDNPLFEEILAAKKTTPIHIFGVDKDAAVYYQVYYLYDDEPYIIFTEKNLLDDEVIDDVDLEPELLEIDSNWMFDLFDGLFDNLGRIDT